MPTRCAPCDRRNRGGRGAASRRHVMSGSERRSFGCEAEQGNVRIDVSEGSPWANVQLREPFIQIQDHIFQLNAHLTIF